MGLLVQTGGGSRPGLVWACGETCNKCGRPFGRAAYDGVATCGLMQRGWGSWCERCWKAGGGVLGQGSGQRYQAPTPAIVRRIVAQRVKSITGGKLSAASVRAERIDDGHWLAFVPCIFHRDIVAINERIPEWLSVNLSG